MFEVGGKPSTSTLVIINILLGILQISLVQGLAYALVALGIVISFGILAFPDLTVDGSSVIGSNGAGKTTPLNLIAGTYFPDEGKIFIDGQEVTLLPEYRRAKYLGRIFQNPLMGTASSMTIEENLSMAELRGKPRGLSWGVTNKQRGKYRELLKTLDRMIMLHEGKIQFDVKGEEKMSLTVEAVVKRFGEKLEDETLLCKPVME